MSDQPAKPAAPLAGHPAPPVPPPTAHPAVPAHLAPPPPVHDLKKEAAALLAGADKHRDYLTSINAHPDMLSGFAKAVDKLRAAKTDAELTPAIAAFKMASKSK